ncbi:hypothetical protein [Haloactinopolyspora sp.]|uniref:hypothetical protein n=1 Tax=Haloactinopolyspora sp. TaxID=1966353 RepID=UPI002614DF85|nr:hypothetical protein [Haloactinopolyspora sp.]
MPVGVRRGARTNAPDASLLDRSTNDAERGRSPQATRAFADVAGPPRGWMSPANTERRGDLLADFDG